MGIPRVAGDERSRGGRCVAHDLEVPIVTGDFRQCRPDLPHCEETHGGYRLDLDFIDLFYVEVRDPSRELSEYVVKSTDRALEGSHSPVS